MVRNLIGRDSQMTLAREGRTNSMEHSVQGMKEGREGLKGREGGREEGMNEGKEC
jgi:hypothetical protein